MANASDKLTEKERLLIKKYGKFYRSLETGERSPTTKDQVHFVEVCQGHAQPKTEHEIAYSKFLGIYYPKTKDKSIEDKNSEWEGKLQRLQEAFENNKIKDKSLSKGKSAKQRKRDYKEESDIDQLDRKTSKKRKYKPKQKIHAKDPSTKKIIFTTKAPIKSEEEIKNEILEKAKKRSSIANYYKPKKSNSKSNIPEYEEGYPKPDWFTDEDWKKMRRQDYADMKKHHRD
jgi:uncharacterized protein YifE (UPF0438 family)